MLRPKPVLVAGGVLLSLLLIGFVASYVEAGRKAALKDAERELSYLSLALSDDTDHALQGAEIIQNSIADRIKAMGVRSDTPLAQALGTIEFHQLLKEKIANVAYIDAITVIDPQGNLVNFSRSWPIPRSMSPIATISLR